MTEPKISLVIPMLNERANVDALVGRIAPVMQAIGLPWEAVCVDDGSTDGTPDEIRRLQAAHPQLVLVKLARNFGQHAAVTAGFINARGEWIVTIDADLQNPPEEIPKLVEAFRAGHDLVNTWRIDRQDTWFRRTASRMTNRLVRKISKIRLSDFGCMLRGYSREVAQAVARCREYKTFIPALASLFAKNPTEVGVAHADRAAGASKYPLRKLLALQLDLVTSFSVYPLRAMFLCGTLLAGIGLALGALIIVLRLYYGDRWGEHGTLTVLGVLSAFCGLQFFAFGLLGEYIGRIFQQVRLREPFLVASIERTGEAVEHPPVNDTSRLAARK